MSTVSGAEIDSGPNGITITTGKRSKAVSSESVKFLIDELPESLLVEILCRLPRKTVIQCKIVSKSWLTLISQPCFQACFLSHQKQTPSLESTLLFVRTTAHEIESFTFPEEQTWVSETHKPHLIHNVVAGTCNDLVLYMTNTQTPIFQRCYYICNPYTKQGVTLPPAPECHQANVHVGLICDSHHRCKVVLILECEKESALFKVEIFSSETCEWTQALVPYPEGLTYDDIRSSVNNVGIAWKGTLYWLCSSGLVMALDPSKFEHCSFISKPDVAASSSCEQCLTVCRGRLRLCQFHNERPCPVFYVWDLKEDGHKWCLKEKIVLDELLASNYSKPVALDPNDEDIVYTLCSFPRNHAKLRNLYRRNIRNFAPGRYTAYKFILPVQSRVEAFPVVIPRLRLPTPVPKLDYREKMCDEEIKQMAEQKEIQVPKVKLGTQGLEVSKLGFGCMGLSSVKHPGAEEDGISIIKHAFSKGITFFDTSDIYGTDHANEILVGKALKQLPREEVQLATKFGIVTLGPPHLVVKGTPEYVRSCCEASLKRLGVDYIDLYYYHRIDQTVPIEETMGELKKLVEEGKIKYVGLSEASPDTIRRAHAVHPIAAVQMEWSLWTRDIEEEIIPLCRERGIGIVPYSPLGRGFFAGKAVVESLNPHVLAAAHPRLTGENLEKNRHIYHAIESLAAKHHCSPAQLALSWVFHQGDDVVPIPGTTKIKNLDTNIGSLSLKLKEDDLKEITDAVPLDQVAGDKSFPITSHVQWKFANTPQKTLN